MEDLPPALLVLSNAPPPSPASGGSPWARTGAHEAAAVAFHLRRCRHEASWLWMWLVLHHFPYVTPAPSIASS